MTIFIFFSQQKHHNRLSDDLSKDIVHSVLGFIMNLTFDSCPTNTSLVHICEMLLGIMRGGSLLDRCLSCLGHLLPHSQEAVDLCVSQDLVKDLLSHAQDDSLVKACVKSLVACTQKSPSAVTAVCGQPEGELIPFEDKAFMNSISSCSLPD